MVEMKDIMRERGGVRSSVVGVVELACDDLRFGSNIRGLLVETGWVIRWMKKGFDPL